MLTYQDAHRILTDYGFNNPMPPKVRESLKLVLHLTTKKKKKRFKKRERRAKRNETHSLR